MNVPRCIISPELGDLKFVRLLGKGAYGLVFEVSSNNRKFALKEQSNLSIREKEIMQLFREKVFVNLVNTLDLFQDENKWYICMEYCEMNLYQRIKQSGVLQPEAFRYTARQIANGVKELHDQNIIHRDLKPENICEFTITDARGLAQLTYKICDFGLSKEQEQNIMNTQNQGTPYYQAPEQIQTTNYDKSIDIWALGCIYYELMTGKPLFNGNQLQEIQTKILRMTQKEINHQIDQISMLNDKYKDLIKFMIVKLAGGRINIDQVIQRLEPSISKSVEKAPVQSRIPPKIFTNYAIQKKTAIQVQQVLPQPQKIIGTSNYQDSQQNELITKHQQVNTLYPSTQQQLESSIQLQGKQIGKPIVEYQGQANIVNSQSVPPQQSRISPHSIKINETNNKQSNNDLNKAYLQAQQPAQGQHSQFQEQPDLITQTSSGQPQQIKGKHQGQAISKSNYYNQPNGRSDQGVPIIDSVKQQPQIREQMKVKQLDGSSVQGPIQLQKKPLNQGPVIKLDNPEKLVFQPETKAKQYDLATLQQPIDQQIMKQKLQAPREQFKCQLPESKLQTISGSGSKNTSFDNSPVKPSNLQPRINNRLEQFNKDSQIQPKKIGIDPPIQQILRVPSPIAYNQQQPQIRGQPSYQQGNLQQLHRPGNKAY